MSLNASIVTVKRIKNEVPTVYGNRTNSGTQVVHFIFPNYFTSEWSSRLGMFGVLYVAGSMFGEFYHFCSLFYLFAFSNNHLFKLYKKVNNDTPCIFQIINQCFWCCDRVGHPHEYFASVRLIWLKIYIPWCNFDIDHVVVRSFLLANFVHGYVIKYYMASTVKIDSNNNEAKYSFQHIVTTC